jgi:ABC-type glycerol-3-phosphate transport system substrate-binding protein
MSTFQIVVLGIFTALILVGIGVFAAFGGVFGSQGVGRVVIWGTVNRQTMQGLIDAMRTVDKGFESVSYEEKDPATYETSLVSAMASGNGPDLFMLPGENLQGFSDKILTIPYGIISQSNFNNSFVDEADLFLTPQGELALPFTIDPMVMYYNRDLFASAGIATPPVYWNDFLTIAPKMTSLDANLSVKKSAVALGEWRNIPSAKAMLTTLFMQAGDGIVVRRNDGAPAVVFGATPQGLTTNPAESALRFYTEFANPTKTSYSWNRSLPQADQMFAAGDLGVYFGYASEYSTLSQLNPNLRFGVAIVPQIEGNSARITYGKIVGLAIPRSTSNTQGALSIAQKLSDKTAIGLISGALSLPPVRRDVGVDTTSNAAAATFVSSALISRGWLDPGPTESDPLFQTMIESVVSGRDTPAGAVSDGAAALQTLFPDI